jgi:type II secretory pathway component PulF
MAAKRLFPPGLPSLLRWAERDKSLSEVLHMAGRMFETRARSHSTFTGTAVTVLCVLLVLGMLMVIPALFLPLITLISRLSG